MADILIRGMDKPFNCFACDLSYLRGERLFCCVTKDEVIRYKIASDCPLHELPEHGDLIEAEPIKRFITDGLNRKEFGYDQIQVLTEVEYAPVIAPADKEAIDAD